MAGNSKLDNLRLEQNLILTNIAKGYSNNAFIGENLLPKIKVPKFSVRIPEEAREHLKVLYMARNLYGDPFRAKPGSRNYTDVSLGETSFEIPIDWQEASEANNVNVVRKQRTYDVTQALLLEREYQIATSLQDASNYITANKATLSGTDQFSHTSATPINKISDAIAAVGVSCGKEANTLAMGDDVWYQLRKHTNVVTAVKGQLAVGVITPDDLSNYFFGVPGRVFIGRAFYDTSEETSDGLTSVKLWTDKLVAAYVPLTSAENRNIYQTGFGYTLEHEMAPPSMYNYKTENGKMEIIQGTLVYAITILDNKCGFLYSDCIA